MSTVTQKGQVTIPKKIREVLGVKKGDEIIFEIEHEKVIVRKKDQEPRFHEYIGYLKGKEYRDSDEIVRKMRE